MNSDSAVNMTGPLRYDGNWRKSEMPKKRRSEPPVIYVSGNVRLNGVTVVASPPLLGHEFEDLARSGLRASRQSEEECQRSRVRRSNTLWRVRVEHVPILILTANYRPEWLFLRGHSPVPGD